MDLLHFMLYVYVYISDKIISLKYRYLLTKSSDPLTDNIPKITTSITYKLLCDIPRCNGVISIRSIIIFERTGKYTSVSRGCVCIYRHIN